MHQLRRKVKISLSGIKVYKKEELKRNIFFILFLFTRPCLTCKVNKINEWGKKVWGGGPAVEGGKIKARIHQMMWLTSFKLT